MGYSDISIAGSDFAADFAANMVGDMLRSMAEEMKEKANRYDTDGILNVAMFFDEFIIPARDAYLNFGGERFGKLLSLTREYMGKKVKMVEGERWDNEPNRKYHLKAYRRLHKRLSDFEKEWHERND